ncbi:Mitochondrial phosphate carrier protein 3, mitochondrial [Capsicum annuum]|nr:Mitochondrial phosphate carrier protein 3, mitochondrial [Capsicum annuum]
MVLVKDNFIKYFFLNLMQSARAKAQGACKHGFYEYFKKYYTDLAGPENAAKYKTLIFLAGSASAEVIADVALCPFEAVKVRVQTRPGFARGCTSGLFLSGDVRFHLGVSFGGGYLAGILCAIVSHPADNLVSFLNNAKGATVDDAVNKLGIMRLCIRGLPPYNDDWYTHWSTMGHDSFKVFVGLPTTGGAAAPAPAK